MVACFVILQPRPLTPGLLNQKDSCKKCKNELMKICLLGCYKNASPVMRDDGLLLGSTGLGTLGTVFAAALCTVLDTCGIEGAAHDVVAYTGKVLYTAATDEHD